MGASLSVKLTQTGKNETSRTGTVNVVVTITSTAGTHNHYGASDLGRGALLYVTIDGSTYSSYVTFGSSETGTFTSTVYSNSFTVSYTSAGTKSVSASARCITGTTAGTISGSDSLSLTPISSSGGSSGDGDDDDDNTEEWDPDNPGGGGSGGGIYHSKTATVHNTGGFSLSSGDAYSVRFTTPKFSGTSTMAFVEMKGVEVGGNPFIGIALCTSDANLSKYQNASELVSDVYRLKNVYATVLSSVPNDAQIETSEIKSETDYYLIFWDEDSSFSADKVNVTIFYTESEPDSGDSGEDPDNPEYRYLWIQKVEGTNVSVSVYESKDNYVDVSDTAEERSNDNGLWYVYTFQQGNFFRFSIAALSGHTLGEITITGLKYDEEFDDYTFNSDHDAYVTVEVTPTTKGVFYIDNGTEYVEYECYIDNGTDWDLVGSGSTGEGEYYRNEGTVTTNSDGTPVSVNCGFTPDLVVLHLNENDSVAEFSTAASFDVHNGPVVTATFSVAMNGIVVMYVDREDQGFSVISYFENPNNPFSLTLNYVAIKYT